jgi:predicted Fe-S protein YdhL (DUF1289 family)
MAHDLRQRPCVVGKWIGSRTRKRRPTPAERAAWKAYFAEWKTNVLALVDRLTAERERRNVNVVSTETGLTITFRCNMDVINGS